MADHVEGLDHNSVYRFLKYSELDSETLWIEVEKDIVYSPNGCILFDDTVLDKRYSEKIELVRRQYSGNAHGVIKGIGVVNGVYYNPELNRFWVIDFRLFDPEADEKTKLNHVSDMLDKMISRSVPFTYVMMDTWYAAMRLMLKISDLQKIFYCSIKANRKVNDSDGQNPYQYAKDLTWSETDQKQGKKVKLWGFPKSAVLKLFRITVSSNRTEYVVTNDLNQNDLQDVSKLVAYRWKIEEFHREEKQLTGIENCQCRLRQSQKNHITCAMLVWNFLKNVAYKTGKTIYQLKSGLLSNYLTNQLKNPDIPFALA